VGTSNTEAIQAQLQRAKKSLRETGETIDRLIKILEPTEKALMQREFQTRAVLDPGEARVVLCLEEELAASRSFKKAISKLDTKKPTLVRIPEDKTSRFTNLTVAKMIPSEVLSKSEGRVLVVNIQRELMLKQLENSKAVIVGQRYFLDSSNDIARVFQTFESQNVDAHYDFGLYGGGALTYELVRTLKNRPKSTVFELTLSKSVAENTNILLRIIESLLSL